MKSNEQGRKRENLRRKNIHPPGERRIRRERAGPAQSHSKPPSSDTEVKHSCQHSAHHHEGPVARPILCERTGPSKKHLCIQTIYHPGHSEDPGAQCREHATEAAFEEVTGELEDLLADFYGGVPIEFERVGHARGPLTLHMTVVGDGEWSLEELVSGARSTVG